MNHPDALEEKIVKFNKNEFIIFLMNNRLIKKEYKRPN